MKLRERLDILVDRFCFGFISMAAGFHIEPPPRYSKESRAYRADRGNPTLRLANPDLSPKPYREDTSGSNRGWIDGLNVPGLETLHRAFENPIQQSGLAHATSYRGVRRNSTLGDGDVEK